MELTKRKVLTVNFFQSENFNQPPPLQGLIAAPNEQQLNVLEASGVKI